MEYNLGFITDEDLFNHVKTTVGSDSFEMNLETFNSNLIDPIKLTFDSIVYQQDFIQTIENEILRQLDKSNSNLIGYFHQNIFNYIGGTDWVVPTSGYDIVNESLKIFVEMKNKHNTMNSSSGAKTYMRFQNTIITDPQSSCLLVEVISRRSQNIPWVISLDGNRQITNERIRRVSIEKFYEIVTGDKTSFKRLCEVLPKVIGDVVESSVMNSRKNSVFSELYLISKDVQKSLFLLAFNNYEGFDKLNFTR